MLFHKIDEKVVSSCLLQYKPVCVINFDKLRRFTPQNAKKNNFSGLFSIAILQKSSRCVTSYHHVLVSFALLLRFDKKLFYPFRL